MTRSKSKHPDSLEYKLLAMIAHDIKIPLDNFAGFLEHYNYSETDQPDYEDLISNLLTYVNASRNLMENILSWAKQYLDGHHNIRQPVLLRLQTDLIISSLKYITIPKSQNIINKIPEMPQININLAVFEFVLRNLLTNSIKFSPVNGWIEVGCRKDKDSVIVSVSDNGTGIAPDKLTGILSFKEGPKPDGLNLMGSGIGLKLCDDLLKGYGGKIWVESIHGKGTTFYFSIAAEY